uniref:Alternative protein GYLTL1B n=1 Tax=Homo sapiens TaxID=9606 RepID=L8E9M0_HUMAN|nr:alternative protein GYLTL1B [Homo sapiens]
MDGACCPCQLLSCRPAQAPGLLDPQQALLRPLWANEAGAAQCLAC